MSCIKSVDKVNQEKIFMAKKCKNLKYDKFVELGNRGLIFQGSMHASTNVSGGCNPPPMFQKSMHTSTNASRKYASLHQCFRKECIPPLMFQERMHPSINVSEGCIPPLMFQGSMHSSTNVSGKHAFLHQCFRDACIPSLMFQENASLHNFFRKVCIPLLIFQESMHLSTNVSGEHASLHQCF